MGFIYNPAAQGIQVGALEFKLEGDLHLRAFLDLADEVRPGYEALRVSYRVKSNAPRQHGGRLPPVARFGIRLWSHTRRLAVRFLGSPGAFAMVAVLTLISGLVVQRWMRASNS